MGVHYAGNAAVEGVNVDLILSPLSCYRSLPNDRLVRVNGWSPRLVTRMGRVALAEFATRT